MTTTTKMKIPRMARAPTVHSPELLNTTPIMDMVITISNMGDMEIITTHTARKLTGMRKTTMTICGDSNFSHLCYYAYTME